jgi:hypothetical protein
MGICLGLALDDNLTRLVPRLGLVHQRQKQPLFFARFLKLLLRLFQQRFTGRFQARIHGQAERVRQPQFPTHVVHQRHAKSTVATHDDFHIGEPLPNTPREVPQIVIRSQMSGTRAVPKPHERDHVRFGTGDRDWQVLILLVKTMKEDQLLLAMRRIVERINVQSDARWRRGEGLQKFVADHVSQSLEIGRCDRILKPGKCRLTGQVDIVRQAITNQLECGIAPQRVVVILVFISANDAVDPLTCHRQGRMQDLTGS